MTTRRQQCNPHPARRSNRSHLLRGTPVAAWICMVLLFASARAQEEPLFEKLKDTFQQEYLKIGILLQTVGDYQGERSFAGSNGFSVANARVNLYGNLDDGFSYLFTTSFVSNVAILDAVVS